MYTVVGATASRTFRVLWLLEELSVPYEQIADKPGSDAVRELNPLGKVPILRDGDAVISDSIAILTYLADKHQRFTFAAGTVQRALQDSHTNFLIDEFDACLWAAARHSFILPNDLRIPDLKETLKWEFKRSLSHLSDRLGDNQFLMGETMTITDIIAGHCAGWAERAGFPIGDPVFQSYIDRLRARPAFAQASRNE